MNTKEKNKEKKYNFDIYGTEDRFRNYEKRINKSGMLPDNKKAAIDFKCRVYAAGQMNKKRILKYESTFFYNFDQLLRKPFKDATRKDIERIVTEVKDRGDWKDSTKSDFVKMLKRYYRITLGKGGKYPKIVQDIKPPRVVIAPIKFEEVPSWSDVVAMAEHTKNLRDRALIKVLWESGARVGELLTLNVGGVENAEHGLYLNIRESKTQVRPVFLRLSAPDLLEWLSSHPLRLDKEAPLFPKLEKKEYWRALSERYILDLNRQLKDLAGVDKKITPHRLRHGSASYFSDFLSDSDMDQKYGWTIGSAVKKRYTHKNRQAVENKILKLAGIEGANGLVNIYGEGSEKQIECYYCKRLNDPLRKVCFNCKRLLDLGMADKIQRLKNNLDEVSLAVLEEKPEVLKAVLDRLSNEAEKETEEGA